MNISDDAWLVSTLIVAIPLGFTAGFMLMFRFLERHNRRLPPK